METNTIKLIQAKEIEAPIDTGAVCVPQDISGLPSDGPDCDINKGSYRTEVLRVNYLQDKNGIKERFTITPEADEILTPFYKSVLGVDSMSLEIDSLKKTKESQSRRISILAAELSYLKIATIWERMRWVFTGIK